MKYMYEIPEYVQRAWSPLSGAINDVMQKLELHANPFSADLCLCDSHIDISRTLVFVKKLNESNLLSCIEPFLLLAQETGNSTGPANGGGVDGRGWGSKSSSKCVAKPSKGLQHTHQSFSSMRYTSALGSSSNRGGGFSFVLQGSGRRDLQIRKDEQKDKIWERKAYLCFRIRKLNRCINRFLNSDHRWSRSQISLGGEGCIITIRLVLGCRLMEDIGTSWSQGHEFHNLAEKWPPFVLEWLRLRVFLDIVLPGGGWVNSDTGACLIIPGPPGNQLDGMNDAVYLAELDIWFSNPIAKIR